MLMAKTYVQLVNDHTVSLNIFNPICIISFYLYVACSGVELCINILQHVCMIFTVMHMSDLFTTRQQLY